MTWDKHLIENGVEKVVTVDFHAGHTRVVEMQVLADIGTALAADGSAHTTGDLGNFRGFYRQIGDILSADSNRWRVVLRSRHRRLRDSGPGTARSRTSDG